MDPMLRLLWKVSLCTYNHSAVGEKQFKNNKEIIAESSGSSALPLPYGFLFNFFMKKLSKSTFVRFPPGARFQATPRINITP